MTHIKRVLLPLLLMSLLVSCASGGASGADGTESSSDTSSSQESSSAADTLTDSVPALDFGGSEFRTIEQESTAISFYSDEANGEIMNDAIFERNRKIEERFNVSFTPTIRQEFGELNKSVTQAAMSGSDEYDLVFGQMFASAGLAAKELLVDWNTVRYVDFDKPWYTKAIEQASVGDKLFMIESDLCVSYTEQTWLLAVNMTKAAEYQEIPDLYSLVRDGKWTVDRMLEIVGDIYSDIDGDSERDEDDFYGLGSRQDGCQLAAFAYGCDIRFVTLGENLAVENTIASEKSVDALTRLAELFNGCAGSVHKSDKKVQSFVQRRRDMFVKKIAMFSPLQVNDLLNEELRNFDDHFGVLPLPKYDEKQSDYYTLVDGGANILLIPISVPESKRDMIGALTEALSAESCNSVTPKYCGSALEQKGTRDEDSMEMLRLILDSRVIDFAYLYDGFKGWTMKIPAMLEKPEKIMSTIESSKKSITSYYESIISDCLGN